jgi:phenylacetate-coenzyme A ligase PaaK-like adenylate-forming protein
MTDPIQAMLLADALAAIGRLQKQIEQLQAAVANAENVTKYWVKRAETPCPHCGEKP